jgi:hypothetical protein
MGVDLKLLFVLPHLWVSLDKLRVERRSELWEEIDKLGKLNIPQPLFCGEASNNEGESCYGETSFDRYGYMLKFVYARELAELRDLPSVKDDWRNRAVWAYISELPGDIRIVLYWD